MATHSSILARKIPQTVHWGRKELDKTEHAHTHRGILGLAVGGIESSHGPEASPSCAASVPLCPLSSASLPAANQLSGLPVIIAATKQRRNLQPWVSVLRDYILEPPNILGLVGTGPISLEV